MASMHGYFVPLLPLFELTLPFLEGEENDQLIPRLAENFSSTLTSSFHGYNRIRRYNWSVYFIVSVDVFKSTCVLFLLRLE